MSNAGEAYIIMLHDPKYPGELLSGAQYGKPGPKRYCIESACDYLKDVEFCWVPRNGKRILKGLEKAACYPRWIVSAHMSYSFESGTDQGAWEFTGPFEAHQVCIPLLLGFHLSHVISLHTTDHLLIHVPCLQVEGLASNDEIQQSIKSMRNERDRHRTLVRSQVGVCPGALGFKF